MISQLPVLRLRKGSDRRLRGGHLWVYSNEVDSKLSPLTGFQPGDAVRVLTADDSLLGTAYMEPSR
jgi:23S rRNA (cytosine1962-C5)-methyltransferase